MKYNMYVFYDDESATIFNEPFSTTNNPNQDELTEEQKIDLVNECQGYGNTFTREQIREWSDELKTLARWDLGGLIFDTIAIVPADKISLISEFGDSLSAMFGDDSSTYKAVEVFNRFIKSHAVKTFTIPCNTENDNWGEYK